MGVYFKKIHCSPDCRSMTAQHIVLRLDSGRIGFIDTVSEFNKCDLPSVKSLLTLDEHDHLAGPYLADPWNKTRRPQEMILRH